MYNWICVMLNKLDWRKANEYVVWKPYEQGAQVREYWPRD